MSEMPHTAEQDLAFLRQLVEADDGAAWRRAFGRTYAMWGAGFAIPLLFEWARWEGFIELPENFWLWAAAVVTGGLTVISVWGAKRWGPVTGAQSKAALAIFAGVGWANVAMLVALILVANALKDGRIMMLHAVVVFAFQGAAWYAVWVLRKRLWTGLVAAGWFAGAVLTGLTLGTPTFILMCALAMLLLMVAPGVAMMREPERA
jgi:hypothetical protein